MTGTGLQGHAGAESPLLSVLSGSGSNYGPRVGVEWGRQTACPGVLSLRPTVSERGPGGGNFPPGSAFTRNREPGRGECSAWDWKAQACSSISPPGPFMPRGELREGLTWIELLLAPEVPGNARETRGVGTGWPGPEPLRALCRPLPCSGPSPPGEVRGWDRRPLGSPVTRTSVSDSDLVCRARQLATGPLASPCHGPCRGHRGRDMAAREPGPQERPAWGKLGGVG